jgi:predicted Rossmann-fold nucleotide-binding protein
MSVANFKRQLSQAARGRRRVIAVIGSGRHADPCCAELGQLIAALDFDLLTGAGQGVMEAVSRAFFETSPRKGIVIGIVPALVTPLEALEQRMSSRVEYAPLAGYPNVWVELAIFTHLPDSGPDGTLRSSRNHINVLSADAIVALPGQEGTEAEAWLAVQYGVPVIACGAYGDRHAMAPHGIPLARSISEVRAFLEAQ